MGIYSMFYFGFSLLVKGEFVHQKCCTLCILTIYGFSVEAVVN